MKFSEFLNEVEIKENNISKAINIYRKLFSKYFSGEFKIISEETYKRQNGEKGSGIGIINQKGYQLRFNWKLQDSKELKSKNVLAKQKQIFLSSIDYWEPINSDFDKPNCTLVFLQALDIIEIWDYLARILKKGIKGIYTGKDLGLDHEDPIFEILIGKKETNNLEDLKNKLESLGFIDIIDLYNL